MGILSFSIFIAFLCCMCGGCHFLFFFSDSATTELYTYGHTLSLHDALPISRGAREHRPAGLGTRRRRRLAEKRRQAAAAVSRQSAGTGADTIGRAHV